MLNNVYIDIIMFRKELKFMKKGFILAEGATHGVNWRGFRKVAFTLAEVLITLGIIGVVAAMTLPSVVANYQKTVWVAQLKKNYSMLEQGFQKMLADDGVDNLSDTQVWSEMTSGCSQSGGCEPLKKYFKFEIKDAPTYSYSPFGGGSQWTWFQNGHMVFNDGARLIYYGFNKNPSELTTEKCTHAKSEGAKYCSSIGTFAIDVNGLRGPNELGRDIFEFRLSNTGRLIARDTLDWLCVSNIDYACSKTYATTFLEYSCSHDLSSGYSAPACIIEAGWKMNY